MNNPNVLVVDDEKSLRDFVRKNLEIRGYKVLTASNGLEALAIFNTERIDLVILDIMLPGIDGLEVCRRLRQGSIVPILMLTARAEEIDRVLGLELGADDYLTKPFAFQELLARVRALLRRRVEAEPPLLQVADLTLDPARRGLAVDANRDALVVGVPDLAEVARAAGDLHDVDAHALHGHRQDRQDDQHGEEGQGQGYERASHG